MAYLIPDNLRTRRDIPPAVGSVARLLADALDDSATVWYEPLFDVEGERPDLVVLIPDTGVLVIEVLQQKASAILSVEGEQLVIKEGEERKTLAHPLARAQQFAHDLAARAQRSGMPADDLLPVAALAVLAYVDAETARAKGLPSVLDPANCLYRDDLHGLNADLTRARQSIAAAMAAPLRSVISENAERLYRAIIHPDTVLTPVQMSIPEFETRLDVDVQALDRQQESLAKTLGTGHRVIRGVAGSGKTVILLHRARLLAKLDPSSKVLVTCYNRSLQGWLERQLAPHGNVKARTLSSEVNRVLKLGSERPQDFDKEDDEDAAQRASAVLDRLGDRVSRELYDHVLIDEAQDFGSECLRFATKLLRNDSESLLVVADAAQSIYRKGFSWKSAGIDAAGRTKVLSRNYRNTAEILDFAWDFLSRGLPEDAVEADLAVVPPDAALRRGPLPLFRHHPSPDAEVLDIAHEVSTWLASGEPAGDIAVLYGRSRAGGFEWIPRLQRAFDQTGVPWYWPTDPKNRNTELAGARDDAVMICTIHSAKGLEFNNVVLFAYLDDHPPEKLDESRRLIYVGMTRAKERLVLTASGNHPHIADLEIRPAQ